MTNLDKRINSLKSLLETRINEYKMLNATLCEMIGRNSSKQVIDSMKLELECIMSEIENINKDLEQVKNEEKEVTYTYYDKNLEEKKSGGFYDSIIKQTKANEFVEAESLNDKKYKEYDESVYKQKKRVVQNDDNHLLKKFSEDLRNTADSRLQSNRFLVDLKEPLKIPEIMVKSVSFDPMDKRVCICIYDFVTDFGDTKYPILQVLKHATSTFSFNIGHLDANGKVIYTERYSRCNITEVYRDPIDYSNDEFSKIQIFISYQDVEYETSE